MKLKIRHLAPYLPYALKCRWNNSDSKELVGLQYGNESVTNALWTWKDGNKYYTGYLYQCKPILFPLSSLTKEIAINGETFVPIYKIYEFEQWDTDELEEIINDGTIEGIYSDLDLITYSQTERLFEWKIDVFGLIEAGLAEPVTENFNPYK